MKKYYCYYGLVVTSFVTFSCLAKDNLNGLLATSNQPTGDWLQELSVYVLIVSFYAVYWLRQKQ